MAAVDPHPRPYAEAEEDTLVVIRSLARQLQSASGDLHEVVEEINHQRALTRRRLRRREEDRA